MFYKENSSVNNNLYIDMVLTPWKEMKQSHVNYNKHVDLSLIFNNTDDTDNYFVHCIPRKTPSLDTIDLKNICAVNWKKHM